MAMEQREHECWISEEDSIISFKAVAEYVHFCFGSQEEQMNYILNAMSKKSYRVQ